VRTGRAGRAPLAVALSTWALLLVTGCGKTDTARGLGQKDPRNGPNEAHSVLPRWDPPTAANGFIPVPEVEGHPPRADR
jgi:hypothetical protein